MTQLVNHHDTSNKSNDAIHSLVYLAKETKPPNQNNNSVFHTYHMKDLWSYSTPQRHPHITQFFPLWFSQASANFKLYCQIICPSGAGGWKLDTRVDVPAAGKKGGGGRCTGEDWARGGQKTEEEGWGLCPQPDIQDGGGVRTAPPTVHDCLVVLFWEKVGDGISKLRKNYDANVVLPLE